MNPIFLATSMTVIGTQCVSTVTMERNTYHTSTPQGMALERAINDSLFVPGLTPEKHRQPVFETMGGSSFTRHIDGLKFRQLIGGMNG